ncbi:metal-dependent hydrolase family protein [Tessaracoccus lacteus]|uniref:Amidohydrolase family protein n=1 Tax=Tessaracoccus lacteus TaxID=3041766 RepID=A0ABY8Q130_9ACTN|nr:amidohydrolase family protein [Tessaracoccus sp. T21]WGT48142.1 amidohydrolase family protein [Tessaracoccus sp. T21]
MPEYAHSLRDVDQAAPRENHVIIASRVFPATGAATIIVGAVVTDGDGIVWVGPASDLPQRWAEQAVHHPGATILPGLIETHAHLGSYAPRLDPRPDRDRDVALVALSSAAMARQLASLGVTTVQSLGSPHYADVALRDAIASGVLAGPRIVAAGPQLTTTGGHAWRNGAEVDSLSQIRAQVRAHHKAGVDVIKVMATGGFMTAGTAPWHAQFTEDELRAVVEEAHRLGHHTAAHAHGTEGIRRAVRAGFDYIAHASFVDEAGRTAFDSELADELARNGTFVDVCSPPSWPAVAGETIAPRAAELYRHGVRLVTGHDVGAVIPASAFRHGLEQLHEAGLPTTEVLLSATSRAAAAVGLAGRTGVLAPGYAADLIVVDGDPTTDLAALGNLRFILTDGRRFTPQAVEPFDPHRLHPPGGGGPQEARAAYAEDLTRRRAHPDPIPQPIA